MGRSRGDCLMPAYLCPRCAAAIPVPARGTRRETTCPTCGCRLRAPRARPLVDATPAADDAELWQGRPFLARPTGRLVLLAGALVLVCAGGLALLGAAVQRAGVRMPA